MLAKQLQRLPVDYSNGKHVQTLNGVVVPTRTTPSYDSFSRATILNERYQGRFGILSYEPLSASSVSTPGPRPKCGLVHPTAAPIFQPKL